MNNRRDFLEKLFSVSSNNVDESHEDNVSAIVDAVSKPYQPKQNSLASQIGRTAGLAMRYLSSPVGTPNGNYGVLGESRSLNEFENYQIATLGRREFVVIGGVIVAVVVGTGLAYYLSPSFRSYINGLFGEQNGGKTTKSSNPSSSTSPTGSNTSLTQSELSTVTLSPYLNKNGDFCSGKVFWNPWDNVAELGYSTPLPKTKWGYEIRECEYGRLWIDNPNLQLWDHCGLQQLTLFFPPESQWDLSDNNLALEAEVMLPEKDSLYTTDPKKSWSRVAIALQWEKKDGTSYVFGNKTYENLYSEFDVFRDNASYFYVPDSNVREYHVDQLPVGVFKKYKINLNDYFVAGVPSQISGVHNPGGWGQQLRDQSRIASYYLVVEVQGSKASAAWRNIKVFQI